MQQTYDPRNRDIFVNINGKLSHRDAAAISPFDSSVQGGDAVWEGLRVHHGRIAFLDMHLDRLFEAAKAIDLDIGLDRGALTQALYRTPRTLFVADFIGESNILAGRMAPAPAGFVLQCGDGLAIPLPAATPDCGRRVRTPAPPATARR